MSNVSFARASFDDLEGIDGWLIVMAVGLALAPLLVTRTLITSDLPILFSRGTLAALLVGVVFSIKNLITLAALVFLNCLFYLKKRIFPSAKIVFYAWAILTRFGEHVLYAAIFPDREIHMIDRTVFAPLLAAAIWIPYLLISKRVKMTFVR